MYSSLGPNARSEASAEGAPAGGCTAPGRPSPACGTDDASDCMLNAVAASLAAILVVPWDVGIVRSTERPCDVVSQWDDGRQRADDERSFFEAFC